MLYVMRIYVDGGCRGNGQPGSIGAASAVLKHERGTSHQAWTKALPQHPRPTNQRAELTAIILGLELALHKSHSLNQTYNPDVTIHSDSRYALDCVTTWIHEWRRNGWVNFNGRPVANRDLIERASYLNEELGQMGELKYLWVPREENEIADRYCNESMDAQSGRYWM